MEKTYIFIDDHVFDVTDYIKKHPGGGKILRKFHLKDATKEFNAIKGHSDEYAYGLLDDMHVCSVEDFSKNGVLCETEKNNEHSS